MAVSDVALAFGLIAVAELPDKTMVATLVMGSRSRRPVFVWAGAAAAFVVHTAVAVSAGRLVLLLPHTVLEAVTTVLFLAGAAYLLLVPERREEAAGEREAAGAREAGGERETGGVGEAAGEREGPGERGWEGARAGAEVARRSDRSPWRVVAAAFGVILVGELGDLTQILTLNLAARTGDPFGVFVGATAALFAVAALGAWGGRALLRWLPLAVIRRAGGVVLVGFGAYGLYGLLR